MNRPESNEFDPYYNTYVSLINEEDVLPVLRDQPEHLKRLFEHVPEEKGTYAYEAGKWSVKEVLSHLIDGERIFSYRVLRISRGDETPIEGFEQDGYIENSNANGRCFADLIAEFSLQRKANMLLLENLSDEASRRMGTASEKPISVRALAYIMAGHVAHHMNILTARYLA
ncbi:MAG: DinB family protein [Pyrinomonadaceae bacterium]